MHCEIDLDFGKNYFFFHIEIVEYMFKKNKYK